MKLEFSQQIFENTEMSNFMKTRQWEPICFMRIDRRDKAKWSLFKILRTRSKHTKVVLPINSWHFQVPNVFRNFACICSTRINELLLSVFVHVTLFIYFGLILVLFTC